MAFQKRKIDHARLIRGSKFDQDCARDNPQGRPRASASILAFLGAHLEWLKTAKQHCLNFGG